MWIWKSIKDAGGQLSFGSDWPVVGLDPRLGLHTAITRQTLNGEPAEGFIPEQQMTLESALDAYTRGSAFADTPAKQCAKQNDSHFKSFDAWSNGAGEITRLESVVLVD